MSDEPREFSGGEPPCSEGLADPPNGSGLGLSAEDLRRMMDELPPELLNPDLPSMLASMVAALEGKTLQLLGLMANPISQELEPDLPQARIAIDVIAYVVNQVSPMLGDSQRRELQRTVSTLQMNFVQRSQES